MRLHVLFDPQGKILAAATVHDGSGVHVRPTADERAGHGVAELEVPRDYHDRDLAAMCRALHVDLSGKAPALKAM